MEGIFTTMNNEKLDSTIETMTLINLTARTFTHPNNVYSPQQRNDSGHYKAISGKRKKVSIYS